MAYDRASRERMGRLAHDMGALIRNVEAQGRKGLNGDERARWQDMEQEYSRLEMKIIAPMTNSFVDRMAQVEPSRVSEFPLEQIRDEYRFDPRQRRREQSPRDRAFSAYLRTGFGGLNEDDRSLVLEGADPSVVQFASFKNVTSTLVGSQGGVLVPQGFSYALEKAMKWFGGVEDGVVGQFTSDTGNPLPWPTVNDTTNRGRIIGQNVQVTQTDPVFNSVTFQAYIGCSDLCLIPIALMQDAGFDLDALVAELLGTRLGRLLNWKCTVGTGTNEPTGIVTAAVSAGLTNILPNGSTASIAYTDLVNSEHTVDAAYRFNPGAYWMFGDTVLKLLKKLVDTSGRPLWQPGLTASFGDGAAVDFGAPRPTILGHPYVINMDMAAPAASANALLFGDMSRFKVRRVQAVQVLRLVERYADYLQVGFIAFLRFDSNLIDAGTHPIVVQQQSSV